MSEYWPDCMTYQEMQCMHKNGLYEPKIEANLGRCLRPTSAMSYKTEVKASRPLDYDYIGVWFKYSTGQLNVKEEIPILGLATFIGSIGGSLGLFLGFSCYDYFSKLIKKLTSIVVQ